MNAEVNNSLFVEIAKLIDESRISVAKKVNAAMSLLYWRVGKIINEEV